MVCFHALPHEIRLAGEYSEPLGSLSAESCSTAESLPKEDARDLRGVLASVFCCSCLYVCPIAVSDFATL